MSRSDENSTHEIDSSPSNWRRARWELIVLASRPTFMPRHVVGSAGMYGLSGRAQRYTRSIPIGVCG